MLDTVDIEKWLTVDTEQIIMVCISAVVTYSAILAYTRIVGLRSLSKMTSADFATTLAIGSLFASTISAPNPTLAIGLLALACLYGGQLITARLRLRFPRFAEMIDNKPLLLMAGSRFLDENLKRASVTRSDIYGKLREANAINSRHVLAVVFEPTGDISVLHSDDPDARLEPAFMEDVADAEELFEVDR